VELIRAVEWKTVVLTWLERYLESEYFDKPLQINPDYAKYWTPKVGCGYSR
jgi:hypothetical protein